MVAGVLIERQRCGQHTAATVRHTDHIEVSLQNTVLARRAVNRDIRKIEGMFYACARKRKIILVDGIRIILQFPFSIFQCRNGIPVLPVKDDDRHVITLLVDEGVQPCSRPERYLMFAAVSSRYNSYLSFHFLLSFRLIRPICGLFFQIGCKGTNKK